MVLTNSSRAYSAERLFGFSEYSQRTLARRVFLVLSLTVTLAFVILLVVDLVPLQDPSAGWNSSIAFWVRTALNAIVIIGGVLVQTPLVISDVQLTKPRLVIITAGVCARYGLSLILLSKMWAFPVPFTLTVGGVLFCLAMAVSAIVAFGAHDRARLWAFLRFTNNISIQASLIIAYPSYNALFLTLEGPSQLAFVLVLPVMKHVLKLLITKVQAPDYDLVPAILSSVDIFDALYMAKCMQSAGSIGVACDTILVDVAQNVFAMFGIARQTHTLRELYRLHKRPNNAVKKGVTEEGGDGENSEPSFFRFLPDNTEKQMQRLVQESVQLLHECEATAVIEYIEAVMPVIYALCVSIFFHLPNAQYYEDMRDMSVHKLHAVVLNILVYAAMELLSLVWVHHMLQCSFGLSIFWQLAFTLENEWRLFQGNFVVWILVVFQFLLVHYGADFSFTFAWIHRRHIDVST